MDQSKVSTATEIPTQSGASLANNKPKKCNQKGLTIGLVICAICAVGGVGFGIYELISANNKDAEIARMQAEQASAQAKLQEGIAAVSETVAENIQKTNPIIQSTQNTTYGVYFTSNYVVSQDNSEQRRLNLNIENGSINHCSVDKYVSEHSGSRVGDCTVNGITGKIYKIAEIGAGRAAVDAQLAFIMEDGTVEYLPLDGALWNADFNIKGKVKIDGFVTDILRVNASSSNTQTGGFSTSLFVLSDGSFVQYDKALL